MIELHKVRVSYSTGDGLEQATMHVDKGEFVFLVGPSGAGKTTLLRTIYMDLKPVEGHVRVNEYHSLFIKDKQIPFLRRTIGVVFQDFRLFQNRNVYENVAFVLEVTGKSRKEIKKRALRVLADVGLSHKSRKYPHELSGGEQQRLSLARAIVNEPKLLLADEPTGNLDPDTADEIMQLLLRVNRRGTAVIMATHNYDLVRRYPHRIIHIKNGLVSQE
jgi:cell division transport system ATP-binding protein